MSPAHLWVKGLTNRKGFKQWGCPYLLKASTHEQGRIVQCFVCLDSGTGIERTIDRSRVHRRSRRAKTCAVHLHPLVYEHGDRHQSALHCR